VELREIGGHMAHAAFAPEKWPYEGCCEERPGASVAGPPIIARFEEQVKCQFRQILLPFLALDKIKKLTAICGEL